VTIAEDFDGDRRARSPAERRGLLFRVRLLALHDRLGVHQHAIPVAQMLDLPLRRTQSEISGLRIGTDGETGRRRPHRDHRREEFEPRIGVAGHTDTRTAVGRRVLPLGPGVGESVLCRRSALSSGASASDAVSMSRRPPRFSGSSIGRVSAAAAWIPDPKLIALVSMSTAPRRSSLQARDHACMTTDFRGEPGCHYRQACRLTVSSNRPRGRHLREPDLGAPGACSPPLRRLRDRGEPAGS
jgi:hypothetical protein